MLCLSALVVSYPLFGAAILFEALKRRLDPLTEESDAGLLDRCSFNSKEVPKHCIFNPADRYISLIIPAYNEEQRLPRTLDEIMVYLQHRARISESFSYEVVIVDDGSSDGTGRKALEYERKHADNVRVIFLGENRGKGEATKRGMLQSRGGLILMLDADGATKVADLEKLEDKMHAIAKKEFVMHKASASKTPDVPIAAFGSRAHLQKRTLAKRKWYRNFLMKGFHILVLLVTGPGVCDTQCGFKMFTRTAARKLFSNTRLKRWCFDVELLYLCKHFGIPTIEIPVNWSEIPGSKVKLHSIFDVLWELALLSLGYSSGVWEI